MKRSKKFLTVVMILLSVFGSVVPAVASGLMDITKIKPYATGQSAASTIYYGKNSKGDQSPIQWRVLAVNPNGADDYNNMGVLLLSQNTLWKRAFDTRTKPYNQKWGESQIRADISGLKSGVSSTDVKHTNLTDGSFAKGAFGKAEYNAILDTTHKAGGGGSWPHLESTDRIFLLSYEEANYVKTDQDLGYFKDTKDRAAASGPNPWWWLRSPSGNYKNAYYVSNTGLVVDAKMESFENTVRPALNLNPESVLFLSAAVDGKDSASVAGTFGIDNTYTGANGWKVTINDAYDEKKNPTGIKAPTDVVVTQEQVGSLDYMAERSSILDLTGGSYTTTWGNSLLVSYNADAIIDNKANMVSALAVTGGGTEESPYTYKDYASISPNASETQRKVNIDNLQPGDKILVYAEQANGDKKTDYASDLVDTGVTIQKIGTDAGSKNEGTLSAAYKDKDLTANIGQKFKLGLEQASYNTKVNVGEGGGEVFGGATISKLEVEDDVTVTGFVTAKETEIKTEGKKITTNGVFVSDKYAAIGYGSVASEENTISVGASGSERKIVNVAAGKNDTDAANVGQMNTALATKQDKLIKEQLAAVNSGITSDKVMQYDSYATTIETNKALADAAIKKNADDIATNQAAISDEVSRAKAAEKINADAIAANKTAINDVASDIITGFTSTGGAVKAVKADNSTLDVAQLHNGVVNGGTITTGENNKKYLTLTVKDEYTGATKTLPGISLEGISSTITIEGQTVPLTNGANIAFTPVYDTDGKTVKAMSIGLQDEISLGSANFNTGNGYVWVDEDGISMTERGDEEGSNYGKFSEMTTDHITLGYQTTATDEKIYAALRPDSLTIDGHDYITKAGLNAGDKEIANVAVAELAENGNYAATTGQLFETNKIVEANKATIATAYTAASYSNNTLTLTRANGSTTTLTIAGGGGGEDQKAVHYNEDKTRIDLEGNGGTTISNLKAGVNDTDAVNVKQMNTLLAGKQDTLSENQLAAVNSGITAEKVAKYEGYDARINNIGKTGTEAASAKKVNETDKVASANAPGSIAQAYNASVSEASTAGIALGYGATVASDQEPQSNINNANEKAPGAEYATALGSYSKATANLSTALGAGSLADEANTVSVGNAQTGLYRRITNVATPLNANDAVNKAYVDSGFSKLSSDMSRLDERTRQVGSHAAALSALHPLPYNPDTPTSFSAGVGTYRDETSYAIGVFHYTSDRFMFNLAASVTEGADVMGRAGMSFSLGKSSKKIAKKETEQLQAAMADMKKDYADLNNQLASQKISYEKRIQELKDRFEDADSQNTKRIQQLEMALAKMTELIETKQKAETKKQKKVKKMQKKKVKTIKNKNLQYKNNHR
ncbi:MAG: DUF6273 domain-containing protein [Synergistaceae bacterium]|nr:DUF6273 domain-containing protein [Synergistaceae bacterium]